MTTDGYTVTTVEPDGPYKDQSIGRVFLLRDDGDYDWWIVGSVAGANCAAEKAPKKTRKEFMDYMNGLSAARMLDHGFLYAGLEAAKKYTSQNA